MAHLTSLGRAANGWSWNTSPDIAFSEADLALLSCIISCGQCEACGAQVVSNRTPDRWVGCVEADDVAQVQLSDIVATSFDDDMLRCQSLDQGASLIRDSALAATAARLNGSAKVSPFSQGL